jgi:CheY-like chemotaxis protein
VLARSSALCDAAGRVKLLMCQLQIPGREQPRLAGMSELTGAVATGRFSAARAERKRHLDAPADTSAPMASEPTATLPRPTGVTPTLSSVRAASVMLAPRVKVDATASRFSRERPPDVLVIDDHAVNQELMAQMLMHLGCRARCAGSAELGLADLCERPVDLVMMDIRMPGMDGLQALSWIRQGPSPQFALRTHAALPVVAVTAHAVAGDADRCLEHGFDAYLAKPCRLEDLRLVLEGLLAWRPAEPSVDAGDTQPDHLATGQAEPIAPRPLPTIAVSGDRSTVPAEPPADAARHATGQTDSTSRLGEGIPVFDHQALHRLRALDPSGQNQLLVRVMKAFELSLQRLSTQLRDARQQQDVSAVRHAAHTLKSSSASVGALRLSGLCLDVETALRRAGASFDVTPATAGAALAEPVDHLLDEIDRVQAALPAWLASDACASSMPSGGEPGAAACGAKA